MANITNVDYEAIPAQARQIRVLGQDLNKEINTVYQSVANTGNCWYGTRYNELVKLFNNMIPGINDLLELVVGEIPFALENVANNYSQVDNRGKITSANKTAPNKINFITERKDVGMRFVTNEVEAIKNSISNNFKNAINKMNSIESTYKSIPWNSEAREEFSKKFSKLKSDIVSAFENIDNQFTRLMNATITDMEKAEKANTVQ